MDNISAKKLPFSHLIDVSSILCYETMKCNKIDGRGMSAP
jgi:hypothetical protein